MSQYFPVNPDLIAEGCAVTGLVEDGVVFPEIEIFERTHCFIGRTALIEAVAMVLGVTPDDVRNIADHVPRITELEADLAEVRLQRDAAEGLIAGLRHAFQVADDRPDQPAPKTRAKKPKPDAPADLE